MIEYIVMGLFFIDMIWSYFYIKRFRDRHPDKDWTVVEANPILRNCIKSMGLEKGIIIGSIVLFVLLVGIIIQSTYNFN